MPTITPTRFAVEAIQDEARRLVQAGVLRRSATIAHLKSFFPDREWPDVARELELCDYSFTDPVCDLLGHEEWSED